MADVIVGESVGYPGITNTVDLLYKDMGDGTHALRVYTGAATGGSDVHIGQVGGAAIVAAQTPTITAGAYSAKDAVGGKLTFANAARMVGGSGILQAITIICKTGVSAELVLTLFDTDFTANNDNVGFDPSYADLANCIAKILIAASDYHTYTTRQVAQIRNLAVPFKLPAVGTSIFGQLMCTGTPTYTATDGLTVKLHIMQD